MATKKAAKAKAKAAAFLGYCPTCQKAITGDPAKAPACACGWKGDAPGGPDPAR